MFRIFKKKKEIAVVAKEEQIENFIDVTALLIYFKNETGIDFGKKEEIISTKLSNFCRNRGFYDFKSFLNNLKADNYLKQELIDYLTVNETYFYREFHQIEELVEKVKKNKDKVRVLCVPSSTGEEPYSIAIALMEANVTRDKFEIVGIDINSEVIDRAKSAVYKSRSLHKIPSNVREVYFNQKGERYYLVEGIKKLVSFRVINLFSDAFLSLGKFDYIFCRNMMIYFDEPTKQKAKSRLELLIKNSNEKIFYGHADN
jgi:chemotaxis protein methyltransferase CheR